MWDLHSRGPSGVRTCVWTVGIRQRPERGRRLWPISAHSFIGPCHAAYLHGVPRGFRCRGGDGPQSRAHCSLGFYRSGSPTPDRHAQPVGFPGLPSASPGPGQEAGGVPWGTWRPRLGDRGQVGAALRPRRGLLAFGAPARAPLFRPGMPSLAPRLVAGCVGLTTLRTGTWRGTWRARLLSHPPHRGVCHLPVRVCACVWGVSRPGSRGAAPHTSQPAG